MSIRRHWLEDVWPTRRKSCRDWRRSGTAARPRIFGSPIPGRWDPIAITDRATRLCCFGVEAVREGKLLFRWRTYLERSRLHELGRRIGRTRRPGGPCIRSALSQRRRRLCRKLTTLFNILFQFIIGQASDRPYRERAPDSAQTHGRGNFPTCNPLDPTIHGHSLPRLTPGQRLHESTLEFHALHLHADIRVAARLCGASAVGDGLTAGQGAGEFDVDAHPLDYRQPRVLGDRDGERVVQTATVDAGITSGRRRRRRIARSPSSSRQRLLGRRSRRASRRSTEPSSSRPCRPA